MSQTVATFATIFFSMILVNNYVLVQFLGICPFLGTANTMGCLTEGLGMMLPNGALWPSSTSQRRFSARQTGAAVVDLVRRGIKPSDI